MPNVVEAAPATVCTLTVPNWAVPPPAATEYCPPADTWSISGSVNARGMACATPAVDKRVVVNKAIPIKARIVFPL